MNREAECKIIHNQVLAAFSTAKAKEFDRLDSLHEYGTEFSKFDLIGPLDPPENAVRMDSKFCSDSEKEFFGALTSFDYRIDDLKVDLLSNDVAIATFYFIYSAAMNQNKADGKARSTLVFRKSKADGVWRIIHEHFSEFPHNAEDKK